jgi:phosphatidylglycerol---prolipoprotein diacylglyceryl transferase
MIQYPNIDPEILRIGPVAIRWYGLMYLAGFLASWFLVRYQIKKLKLDLGPEFIETLYSYLILGLLLGARLGEVIFYNPVYYFENPFEIIAIWHGGMSFHGGLIGAVAAGLIYCQKAGVDTLLVSDMVMVTAPIGLGLGRIANFINAELVGRVTDVPWAMIFPGEILPRHPSQLYEFFLEGVLLFTILWLIRARVRRGTVTALFLVLYGVFRSFVELFREPDEQLGFFFGFLTMGQMLSLAMIIAGILIYIINRKQKESGRTEERKHESGHNPESGGQNKNRR